MFTVLNALGKLCKFSGTVHANPDEFENARILFQNGLNCVAKNTRFEGRFRKVPFSKMFSDKTKAQTWRFQTDIHFEERSRKVPFWPDNFSGLVWTGGKRGKFSLCGGYKQNV